VDRHCSQMRVWHKGQTDPDGKPRILHPQFNELDSVSHTNLGKIMGERQVWFDWLGRTCLLDNIRSGKIYIGEEEVDIVHLPATVTGFKELEGVKARGHCEAFCTPGYLRKDKAGNLYFIQESFSTAYCNAALEDPHLLGELPNPHRILTVPFPFLDPKGKGLIYPGPRIRSEIPYLHGQGCPGDQFRDAGQARERDPGRHSRGVLLAQPAK
jgi:hypothetical protein